MVPPATPRALLRKSATVLKAHGYNLSAAARALRIARSTLQHRVAEYERRIGPLARPPRSASLGDPPTAILAMLRRGPQRANDLAEACGLSTRQVEAHLNAIQASGVNLHRLGTKWSVEKEVHPSFIAGAALEYKSRKDNTYLFGAVSDNHLGSKYERLDVLHDLYDRFAARGITRVFNAGNWIDGEARFNKFDIHTHGMDAQLAYLAKHYPQRPGITTYAVTGDDHEGWYAQREGVDIGRYAERVMRAAGRTDWVNLGYMEAHVSLVNAKTGARAVMAVVHPGGGSAYALSYSIQKTIESLDGGEKPAVGLYGHYHKQWAGNIRNVWCLQTGCTEDQTPFMRKKKLEAHVGGAIVELEQDARSGAIVGFTPKMIRYFNKGFYNNRWNPGGGVALPARAP
ncbi:MAG: helix-turn-helix domain-containing protein [Alphaproteobacteria bacterium]